MQRQERCHGVVIHLHEGFASIVANVRDLANVPVYLSGNFFRITKNINLSPPPIVAPPKKSCMSSQPCAAKLSF